MAISNGMAGALFGPVGAVVNNNTSKGKEPPQYPHITAPTVMTGNQGYTDAQNFFNQNGYGNLLTAQGNALQEAQSPAYYNSFQPSSFAQALGNQSFQNIWPNEQAAMAQQQSNSGQAYSPGAAEAQGLAYGNLATGIGEYLNQQGIQEANTGIQAGMSINPMNLLEPYAGLATTQSNNQAGLNMTANLANAGGSYANQLVNYQNQMGINGAMGQIGGGLAGAAAGSMVGMPMQGAMMGAGMGGALMGSQNSMAPYMQAMQYFNTPGSGNNNTAGINYNNAAGNQSWMANNSGTNGQGMFNTTMQL